MIEPLKGIRVSNEESNITRRNMLTAAGAVAAGVSIIYSTNAQEKRCVRRPHPAVGLQVLRQNVVRDLAAHAARIGLKGFDLAGPGEWATLEVRTHLYHDPRHGITKGLNRIENHECLAQIRKAIENTADAGFPNVICFSGNRAGMDDEEGLKNCEIALKQVVGLAEEKKVTICMELLNSKRNHADYMCDRTHWGAKLVRKIGSARFKLLYDIYHMQVQEGDVIATIREYADCIGHYHTAGVPGRNEFDETQELYYPAIMKAILNRKLRRSGVRPEKPDPLASLTEAVEICDV